MRRVRVPLICVMAPAVADDYHLTANRGGADDLALTMGAWRTNEPGGRSSRMRLAMISPSRLCLSSASMSPAPFAISTLRCECLPDSPPSLLWRGIALMCMCLSGFIIFIPPSLSTIRSGMSCPLLPESKYGYPDVSGYG